MALTILQNVYRDDNHTYLLVDNGPLYAWADAEADAVAMGGHLVTINNASENNFVYDTFAKIGNDLAGDLSPQGVWFWLGYNDAGTEGSFVWSSGSSASHTSWYPGYPHAENPTHDYAAFFFYSNYAPGFDPTRKWLNISDDDPNNYALAIIEIPHLLATSGKDKFTGGIGDDRLAGLGGDDTLKGLDGNDELNGGDDDDRLDGGDGADELRGGDGDDTYDVGSGVDTIIESADGGTDTVRSTYANYTLAKNVENLVQLVSGGATGNGERNTMKGSSGFDYFRGAGGNDTLYGNDGGDTLEAGTGKDKLFGGDDDDTLVAGGGGGDVLEGGAGFDHLGFWTGDDTAVYKSAADIGKGTANGPYESIARFDKGHDLMDLSAVDANGSASGNGKFKFIGSKDFSDHRGELRATNHDKPGVIGDYILVEGDTNGDGKADFNIRLDNFDEVPLGGGPPFKLSAGDFVL